MTGTPISFPSLVCSFPEYLTVLRISQEKPCDKDKNLTRPKAGSCTSSGKMEARVSSIPPVSSIFNFKRDGLTHQRIASGMYAMWET